MSAKICVITGASSGIGLAAAGALGTRGYRLILTGRDPARGAAALAQLRDAVPAIDASFLYADLSSLAEMRRLGAEIAAAAPRIDLLVNNAGGMVFDRRVTVDGLERTFAVNHLAYFVLTNHLLPNLIAAAPARIVSVASAAHRGVVLDFDDLQSERGYAGLKVYGRSKLANILFTRALARRLEGSGVTANCVHPGFVATAIGDDNRPFSRGVVRFAKRFFAGRAEDGAETVVYAATSPDMDKISGAYLVKSRVALPTAAAHDDAAGERLWVESERLSGMVASSAQTRG